MIADRAFADRVLAQVDERRLAEDRRRRWRPLLPLAVIALAASAWTMSLLEGAFAVHLLIRLIAWLSAVGRLEEQLSVALLGPFAPIPLVVSLLLFVAATAWVRAHQPDVPETYR